MLKIESISKSFKNRIVFKDVSFNCEPGKIYGFIGPNGCGKSVLFKVICGFLTTESGTINYKNKILGIDMDFLPSLGVLIEKPGFIENYTHIQNLQYLASIQNKISTSEIIDVIKKVGLDSKLKQKVKNYSLGMRQRLGIAQAIMEEQEIIILDEPFNGLDKDGQKEVKLLINDLRKKNRIILLTSHIEGDIDELADVAYEFVGNTLKQIK